MKTFGLAVLFAIVMTLNGCELFFHDNNPPRALLWLSFQDASGKDLVEGIGYNKDIIYDMSSPVDPELYTMKIIYPNESLSSSSILLVNFNKGPGFFGDSHELDDFPEIIDSYHYLYFNVADEKSKKISIFLLTCPYIFGDDAEHEIMAYYKKKGGGFICNRLIFDGQEVETIKHSRNGLAVATIVLD